MSLPISCLVYYALISFDDYRGPIRAILKEDPEHPLTPIWGINDEGDPRTAWREVGVPNVWYMMGTLD